MQMHFRFILSYDNSEKYQYFMKKSMYFEKITRENRPEAITRRAIRDVIMLLLVTLLAKERETAVKSVM